MKTLLVADYGVKISTRKGVFVISSRDRKHTVSPSDIDVLVIATSGVSITSSAARLAARHGVEIVFLDSSGMPVSMLYMPFYTRTPGTRRAQYQVYNDGVGVGIAVEFAVAKMLNQARHLRWRAVLHHKPSLREAAGVIEEYAEELSRKKFRDIDSARRDIMLLEANAARAYWAGIAELLPRSLGFNCRDKDSCDPVNLALNYGYGILYPAGFKALLLAGLDPYAGFLHVDRSGKPVLVFDFIEMFRISVVDKPLVDLFLRGWRPRVDDCVLSVEDRRVLAEAVVKRFSTRVRGVYDQAAQSLEEMMKVYAYRLARSIRNASGFRGFIER